MKHEPRDHSDSGRDRRCELFERRHPEVLSVFAAKRRVDDVRLPVVISGESYADNHVQTAFVVLVQPRFQSGRFVCGSLRDLGFGGVRDATHRGDCDFL